MLKTTTALAIIAGLAISSTFSYGFHSSPAEMAITDVLNKFDAVVISRLDSQELSGPSTHSESNERSVKVTEVIRDDANLKGTSIRIHLSKDQVNNGIYLVVGRIQKKTGDMRWRMAKPISKLFRDHILRVDGLTGTGVNRLVFFQRFLHHDDLDTSSNAHREIVNATDDSFDDFSKSVDRALSSSPDSTLLSLPQVLCAVSSCHCSHRNLANCCAHVKYSLSVIFVLTLLAALTAFFAAQHVDLLGIEDGNAHIGIETGSFLSLGSDHADGHFELTIYVVSVWFLLALICVGIAAVSGAMFSFRKWLWKRRDAS